MLRDDKQNLDYKRLKIYAKDRNELAAQAFFAFKYEHPSMNFKRVLL